MRVASGERRAAQVVAAIRLDATLAAREAVSQSADLSTLPDHAVSAEMAQGILVQLPPP